jgi:hypothetical protein
LTRPSLVAAVRTPTKHSHVKCGGLHPGALGRNRASHIPERMNRALKIPIGRLEAGYEIMGWTEVPETQRLRASLLQVARDVFCSGYGPATIFASWGHGAWRSVCSWCLQATASRRDQGGLVRTPQGLGGLMDLMASGDRSPGYAC